MSRLVEFATRYTVAWCSHSASNVAMFYSESKGYCDAQDWINK